MKKCMHKIENMPLQTSLLFPVPDSLVLPVKSSVWLYSIRKPRACQKLWVGAGVGKGPAPGQRKICKCPAVALGVGAAGGGGGWEQLELTNALVDDLPHLLYAKRRTSSLALSHLSRGFLVKGITV